MTDAPALAKWRGYYTRVDEAGQRARPPWEREMGPASYVMELVQEGLLPAGARTLELGSGVGLTSIHLAGLGYEALAVDLVPEAIAQGQARERALQDEGGVATGPGVRWIVADMFSPELLERVPEASVDLVIDIQCFHIFPTPHDRHRAAGLIQRLLKPGGKALIVTGNDTEPPRNPGPPALSWKEVLEPFLGPGASGGEGGDANAAASFRLLRLREGRFDVTPSYGASPPLCWVALFERI